MVNASFLVIIALYMMIIEPTILFFSVLLLLPQAILTPWLQSKLNRLVERQIGLLRKLGDQLTTEGEEDVLSVQSRTIWMIYRNRLRFFLLKFGLKSLLNFANSMAPLTVLAVGGYMVINGQTTIGTVVAFVSGFERLGTPMRDLVAFYRLAAQATVQHQMIGAWLAARERPAAA